VRGRSHTRHDTATRPRIAASTHSISHSIAPTLSRITQATAKIMIACARHVMRKARNVAGRAGFEVSFGDDIDRTWLLSRRRSPRAWARLSLIDGGGWAMKYEDGVYARFNRVVSEANRESHDPTLLFIATDGGKIFKAFTAPAAAVKGYFEAIRGLDDDTFIGVWSHEWIKDRIAALEEQDDPEQGWSNLMQDMVIQIADQADEMSPPRPGNS